MASHLKGVKHTIMTCEMRKALCAYKSENPASSQKELQKWVSEKFNIQISQATISNTIKRSSEYISAWMNDVKNTTIANCFQYCKLRSVENVVSQPLKEEGIRELWSTIKELHSRNAMNVDQLLNYPGENDTTEILTHE